MEITKREILFSAIIICIMIFIGFFISNSISDDIRETNEVFYKSTKIDNEQDKFEYGMKTNIGTSLIYGEVNGETGVKHQDLINNYFAIKKETERYTRHTRRVKSGKTYRTQVYHTWDNINTETNAVDNFTFLNVGFDISKINFNNWYDVPLNETTVDSKYVSWINGSYIYNNGDTWANVGDLRYEYYYIPLQFKGSILVNLKDSSIYSTSDKSQTIAFMYDKTIQEVISDKENSEDKYIPIFWIIWICVTGSSIVGFYNLKNKWLE